jgi:hypothetical protein
MVHPKATAHSCQPAAAQPAATLLVQGSCRLVDGRHRQALPRQQLTDTSLKCRRRHHNGAAGNLSQPCARQPARVRAMPARARPRRPLVLVGWSQAPTCQRLCDHKSLEQHPGALLAAVTRPASLLPGDSSGQASTLQSAGNSDRSHPALMMAKYRVLRCWTAMLLGCYGDRASSPPLGDRSARGAAARERHWALPTQLIWLRAVKHYPILVNRGHLATLAAPPSPATEHAGVIAANRQAQRCGTAPVTHQCAL